MSAPTIRVSADWLALREPADASARSHDLARRLLPLLPADRVITVHDLGSGTGSMMRWLAPKLPTSQRWVLHDRDADLLDVVRSAAPPVAVRSLETRTDDITRLTPAALADADLITASALLDMLTLKELDRIVTSIVAAGCPSLLTISVIGHVALSPADPLDPVITAAFNAHQRRTVDDRSLLGPEAVDAADRAFASHGWTTRRESSPWRLGPGDADLIAEWLDGWVGAAIEWDPSLAGAAHAYLADRSAAAGRGTLNVSVDHVDLLAVPR